jgi:hypothetical protein
MKINESVRLMKPPRYTRAEAARMVGRDADTLKRWAKTGVYRPSDKRPFGKVMVGLYTDDDIKAMKALVRKMGARVS